MTASQVRGVKNAGRPRVHLLSAIDQHSGGVLGQVSVAEKSNEIPCFPTLLDVIKDLKGAIVTADALHTQRSHAEYLHGRGSHFVLTVKLNQPLLHGQCATLPWDRIRTGATAKETANGCEIALIRGHWGLKTA